MENIFFNTDYLGLSEMLLRLCCFILVSGFLIYLIYFLLSKFLFRKNKHRKEINLRIIFLWSLFTYLILFNVYLFFLFYRNWNLSIKWSSLSFYLGIIAQLIVFFGLLAFFYIKRHSLNKIINEKSIN